VAQSLAGNIPIANLITRSTVYEPFGFGDGDSNAIGYLFYEMWQARDHLTALFHDPVVNV